LVTSAAHSSQYLVTCCYFMQSQQGKLITNLKLRSLFLQSRSELSVLRHRSLDIFEPLRELLLRAGELGKLHETLVQSRYT